MQRNKGAAQLIFTFGLAYADCLFSDVAAQKLASMTTYEKPFYNLDNRCLVIEFLGEGQVLIERSGIFSSTFFAWRDSVKQLKRNEDFFSICWAFPLICGVSL